MTLNGRHAVSDAIRTFKLTHDKKLRDELVSAHITVVESQARRLCRKLPSCVDYDDLVSAGTFGLMSSIESFDPDLGVPFSNYCAGRIRGAMLDELRKLDWVPRLARESQREIARAQVTLHNKFMREPTEAEMAEEMGLDHSGYHTLAKKARISSMVPLGCNEHTTRLTNQQRLDPAQISERHELSETLTQYLSESEQYLIKRYYYDSATLKEIGDTVGLSESRVCQMITGIRTRLKCLMSENTRLPKIKQYPGHIALANKQSMDEEDGWRSAPVCDSVPKVRIHQPRNSRPSLNPNERIPRSFRESSSVDQKAKVRLKFSTDRSGKDAA